MNEKKICISCKEAKSLVSFSKKSKSLDGLDPYCRICKSEYGKKSQFKPDYLGSKSCTTCGQEKEKMSFHKNRRRKDGLEGRCKDCSYKRARKNELKRYYNITQEEFNRMLSLQDGKCAICRSNISNIRCDRLSVDHCHETSVVRGLLCTSCNMGLGRFKDNITFLKRAIKYLETAND